MRFVVCSFSAYTKTKFRNQVNAAPDLQIQLSGITSDLKTVMKKHYGMIPIFSLNLFSK
jgi:hypothetical protein